MAEEKKESAESVKIADLPFSEEFLKAENLAADGTVSKDQAEALKKKYEDFQAQSSSEGASGDTTKKKTAEGNETGAEGVSKPNGEEVRFVSKDIQVDNENTWIDRYEAILKGYAEANNQEWKREEKDEEGKAVDGLKGSIGEAKFHFTDENKAIVNAEGINAIVALAKETGQEIAFNEAWSDEFKNKMLAACEAQGVTLQGRPEAQTEQTNTETNEDQKAGFQYSSPKLVEFGFKKYAREAAENPEAFKAKIAEMENKGIKIGDRGTEASHLAMRKYILAKQENKAEDVAVMGEALKRYGIAGVSFEPEGNSEAQCTVSLKDYNSYTPEEKAKIDESVQKLQPKDLASENGGNSGIDAAAIERNKVSVNG